MDFRLDATEAELQDKGPRLIRELAKALSGACPDLSDALEKALPAPEPVLKYPVLQALNEAFAKEYEATIARMLKAINRVLDESASSGRKPERLTKSESEGGWIGVDLDGTLARYDGWKGADKIGEPVPAMVERVKRWLADGKEVRILTARVSREMDDDYPNIARAIEAWCLRHIGRKLPVTAEKDLKMVELWDDRVVRVERNTGRVLAKADLLPGGRADGRSPDEFDPDALAEGTEHELEHTSDRDVAREIAMDHLAEDPDYYLKLRDLEKSVFGSVLSFVSAPTRGGGEGSRGGHIIGHTASGRPIYMVAGHAGHAGYTLEDHHDAADRHEVIAAQLAKKLRDNYRNRWGEPLTPAQATSSYEPKARELADAYDKHIAAARTHRNKARGMTDADDLFQSQTAVDARQVEPVVDHTMPVAEADLLAYKRMKQLVLRETPYTAADFEDGGPLEHWSANELLELVRSQRKTG